MASPHPVRVQPAPGADSDDDHDPVVLDDWDHPTAEQGGDGAPRGGMAPRRDKTDILGHSHEHHSRALAVVAGGACCLSLVLVVGVLAIGER